MTPKPLLGYMLGRVNIRHLFSIHVTLLIWLDPNVKISVRLQVCFLAKKLEKLSCHISPSKNLSRKMKEEEGEGRVHCDEDGCTSGCDRFGLDMLYSLFSTIQA